MKYKKLNDERLKEFIRLIILIIIINNEIKIKKIVNVIIIIIFINKLLI